MAKATAFKFLAVIVALAVGMFAWSSGLHASSQVSFSRPALYELTHDEDDPSQLVDGELVTGTMWQTKSGVGWMADGRPITIEFGNSLGSAMNRACFHLGQRGKAGAHFPETIDVFSIIESKARWVGSVTTEESASSAEYSARWFCVTFAEHSPDSLKVIVRPRGAFFFIDEVRFDRQPGAKTIALPPAAPMDSEEAETFALERADLARSLQILSQSAPSEMAHLIAERREALSQGEIGRSPADLRKLRRDLAFERGKYLSQPGAGFRLFPADPYGAADWINQPLRDEPQEISLANGSTAALAAVVLPSGGGESRLQVSVAKGGAAAGSVQVRLLTAEPILAATGRTVFDPLVPTGSSLTLSAGEPGFLWLIAEAAEDASAGTVTITLSVSDAATGTSRQVNWPVTVVPIVEGSAPQTVVWGYLNSPAVKHAPRQAVTDMLDHGVNTAVLPAADLPWPKGDEGQGQIGNYAQFDRTMALLDGHDQYLFYLALGDEPSLHAGELGAPVYSAAWLTRFGAWISEWTSRMRAAGIDDGQYAFYPVDEVASEEEARRLVQLSELIKAAAPGASIYATVHRPEMISPGLSAAVDIFQLDDHSLASPAGRDLSSAGRPVWLYRAEAGGKATDPRSYYQSLGWKAFVHGLQGFGVWSYSDVGLSGSAWNDLDGQRADFALIYETPNGIVSSRRWEAWREGVQDYRMLASASANATTAAERRYVVSLARLGLARLERGADIADLRRELLGLARRR